MTTCLAFDDVDLAGARATALAGTTTDLPEGDTQ